MYLSRLFEKVGAKDRFELALYGLRNQQNMDGADLLQAIPLPVQAAERRTARQWATA